MYKIRLLEDVKAIPEPLVLETAIPEEQKSIFPPGYFSPATAKKLSEIMTRTEHEIIIPILESSSKEILFDIRSLISPFQSLLSELNRTIFSERRSQEDIPKIAEVEDFLFSEIRKFIIANTALEAEKRSILALWEQLQRYDSVILGLAYVHPAALEEAINVTNTEQLRVYVSGAIMVLLCILSFLRRRLYDTFKLEQLIKIDTFYTGGLKSWIEGIDVLREPEKVQQRTEPIMEDVGMVKPDGFDIDLNKMQTGKKYFFNYRSSRYKAEKINGELLLVEVG